jgi:hypothetical protein
VDLPAERFSCKVYLIAKGGSLLGYLDALIAALSVRDSTEAQRLLAHPLARLLPAHVMAEASAFSAGERDALAAPLRVMQLRYQTAELLRDAPLAADQPEPRATAEPVLTTTPSAVPSAVRTRRAHRQQQMELPLSA